MKCHAPSLFGPWAIAPADLSSMLEVVRSLDLDAVRAASAAEGLRPAAQYRIDDGVAVMAVSGPMTEHPTSLSSILGGTSTIETRATLRKLERDPAVKAVVIAWDSPGGTVAGTEALAAAIRQTDAITPVYGIVDGLCASAAMWCASQGRALYASNRTAQAGGIGTFATLRDSSGAMALQGIKVETIGSGGVKGAGVDGTPITDEYRADVRRRVDALNSVFLSDLAAGRKVSMARARELGDGRVHLAAEAQALGLIDGIMDLDRVIALAREGKPAPAAAPRPAPPVRQAVAAFVPKPAVAQLPELVAYHGAIAAQQARGFDRSYARAIVHRQQPNLRAAVMARLRKEIGGERASELVAALYPDGPEAA